VYVNPKIRRAWRLFVIWQARSIVTEQPAIAAFFGLIAALCVWWTYAQHPVETIKAFPIIGPMLHRRWIFWGWVAVMAFIADVSLACYMRVLMLCYPTYYDRYRRD
jgi:hypothetical protein